MFDLKVNKVFKDENGQDIYLISIKIDDNNYYNLSLTKEEITELYNRFKSIQENGGLS